MLNYIVLKEKISERKCLRRLRSINYYLFSDCLKKTGERERTEKKLKQYISENCSGCGNYFEI